MFENHVTLGNKAFGNWFVSNWDHIFFFITVNVKKENTHTTPFWQQSVENLVYWLDDSEHTKPIISVSPFGSNYTTTISTGHEFSRNKRKGTEFKLKEQWEHLVSDTHHKSVQRKLAKGKKAKQAL